MENNPRAVFERLFGDSDSTDPARAHGAHRARDRSILDSVTDERQRAAARRWEPAIASSSTSISTRCATSSGASRRPRSRARGSCRWSSSRPGIPGTFEEHAKLMFDLLALAYPDRPDARQHVHDRPRGERPRLSRDRRARRAPPAVASPERPEKLEKLAEDQHLPHAAVRLLPGASCGTTPDGDGSLLDHSTLLYGAGMSDSNIHIHDNLPIVLVGGGGGQIKGGRHVRYPKDTPLTNLYLTMLDKHRRSGRDARRQHRAPRLSVRHLSTGGGAPPPPRTDADTFARIPMSSLRYGRRRFSLLRWGRAPAPLERLRPCRAAARERRGEDQRQCAAEVAPAASAQKPLRRFPRLASRHGPSTATGWRP